MILRHSSSHLLSSSALQFLFGFLKVSVSLVKQRDFVPHQHIQSSENLSTLDKAFLKNLILSIQHVRNHGSFFCFPVAEYMFLVSLTWEASAYKCEPHFPTLHHLSQRCHPEASSLFAALGKLVLCCCQAADMLPGAPRWWALPPCPGSPGSQAPPPQGEREGGRITGASAVSGIVRFADSTTVRGGSPRPHGCYCPVTKATAARRPEFCAWPPLLLPGSLGLWLSSLSQGTRIAGTNFTVPQFHLLYVFQSIYLFSGILVCWSEEHLLSYVCFTGYRLKERDKESIFLCHNAKAIPNIIFYI